MGLLGADDGEGGDEGCAERVGNKLPILPPTFIPASLGVTGAGSANDVVDPWIGIAVGLCLRTTPRASMAPAVVV